MRTNYIMAHTLEHQHRSRARLYTGVAALVLTLLILFVKWRVEMPVKPEERTEIEVELNLPPDPPTEEDDGGGGGGNIAQAIGTSGAAPEASLPSGETQPSKEVEDSPDDFNKTGNQGTGWGTGKGSGSGGGTGTGAGGGNGSGVGTGNGPRVTQGNRKIVKAYAFDGEMERATIFAQIRVSSDGKGSFVDFAKGSTHRTNTYKQAIVQYLNRIQFDKSDQEDLVVVQFNFLVN